MTITFSKELFAKLFYNCNEFNEFLEDVDKTDITLKSFEDFIDFKLNNCLSKCDQNSSTHSSGRLGPETVIMDLCSNVGSLVIESDRLSVLSHSGFSSIKANVCVYKGKWQYEIMINSKGVMQMGWATKNCHFSQDKGVGDTNDSYAYDGNRIRKWNVLNSKYGQSWQIGDCITCTLDLDNGRVDFYRNGQHLGTAFENVRIGKSYAYFPAISLAYQESVVMNFGSTPLRFPVEGYKPLESSPNDLVIMGSHINQWLINLISINTMKELSINQFLICNKIFTKFSHIFANKYVIEKCFVENFLNMSSNEIHSILSLMWTLMEEQQIHDFLEMCFRSLVNKYRFSPIKTICLNGTNILDLSVQKKCLLAVLSFLTEITTRRYLINNILFESKFLLILDIKAIEDEYLTSLLFENITIETVLKEENVNHLRNENIELVINEIETIQDNILSALLFKDESSRTAFINKFENFVRETVVSNSRSQISHHIVANLSPVVLSVFQRLTYLVRNHFKDAVNFIGVTYFVDISINNDNTRIGGTASYLYKQNKEELSRYLEESVSLSSLMKDIYKILDNLIKMYPMGAHKHLAKICSVFDHFNEYIKAYKELKQRLEMETIETNEETLQQTLSVLEDKIVSYWRQIILINSIELNETKRESIYWLLRLLLNTLDHSSSCGHLFSFIPDYFIETLISLFSSIRFYFTIPSDTDSTQLKSEYEYLLQHFSSFIASHFCDQRIAVAEIKDNLSQALASLVSNPETLKALESISFEKRIILVKSLCKPYENRAWAQTNWTMLRFWKGSGFGYRYSKPPNISDKLGQPINKDQNSLNNLSPNPSVLYQSLIGEYLKSEPECGFAFISSLLSQLNWTFSEFIGMLQEIQNSVNRPQKVFIDSRQLKICSTCFELTLALLRVLEMIVCVNPELITLSPPNEMISIQLSQILCQILNRLTITGCFDFVIGLEIQELDSISHFQILASVSGILIALVLKGSPESREHAIRSITKDASFVVESLLFLIGSTDRFETNDKKFSLTDFNELNEDEKTCLNQMVSILTLQYKLSIDSNDSSDGLEIPDDQICTICYANKKVALFSCGHKSCRSCIAIHFLRNGEKCFFCKAVIERVVFEDSDQILYPKNAN